MLTVENVPNSVQAAGWKAEHDGRFSLHLCPAHKRKGWTAVREAQFAAGANQLSTPS